MSGRNFGAATGVTKCTPCSPAAMVAAVAAKTGYSLEMLLTDPLVVIGLLIGGVLPFFIGALTIQYHFHAAFIDFLHNPPLAKCTR